MVYSWENCKNFEMPKNSVIFGKEDDGSEIYCGTAECEGEEVPAKIIPSKKECRVILNGEEKNIGRCKKVLISSHPKTEIFDDDHHITADLGSCYDHYDKHCHDSCNSRCLPICSPCVPHNNTSCAPTCDNSGGKKNSSSSYIKKNKHCEQKSFVRNVKITSTSECIKKTSGHHHDHGSHHHDRKCHTETRTCLKPKISYQPRVTYEPRVRYEPRVKVEKKIDYIPHTYNVCVCEPKCRDKCEPCCDPCRRRDSCGRRSDSCCRRRNSCDKKCDPCVKKSDPCCRTSSSDCSSDC